MSLVDITQLNLAQPVLEELRRLEPTVFLTDYSAVGQNGETFFGVHVPLRQKQVLKFYRCGPEDRFHAEPQHLASVDSPHIIDVLDARGLDDDWAVLVMPFCERGNLDQELDREAPSLHTGLDMCVGLASGVSALHAEGLIHRDLKAQNLLVTDDNRLVVGDFGSVHKLPQGANDVVASGHSILYRPPESFDSGRYSTAGDIYQVGLATYQVLGGHLPYDPEAWIDRTAKRCIDAAKTPIDETLCVDAAVQRRIQAGKVLDLGSLPPTVPKAAKRFLRRATRAQVASRHPNAAEIIRDLRRIRRSTLDWRIAGDRYVASARDRDVRIVPHRGQYRAEQNKRRGGGWRKITGVPDSDPEKLVETVVHRVGP